MRDAENNSPRRRIPYQDVAFPATVIAAHSYAELFGYCPICVRNETDWIADAVALYDAGGNEPMANFRVILHNAVGPTGTTVQYRLIQQNNGAVAMNPSSAATVRITYRRR